MTTVPLVYDLQVTRQRCGPHQGTSMKSALVAAIDNQKWVLHKSAHSVICDAVLSTYGQAILLVLPGSLAEWLDHMCFTDAAARAPR